MSLDDLSIQVQARDLLILRSLLESRIMTIAHIAAIHFEDRQEAAKKRLQKLKAAELMTERRRRVNEPSILFLSRNALAILEQRGILSEYPRLNLPSLHKRMQVSAATIQHELEV